MCSESMHMVEFHENTSKLEIGKSHEPKRLILEIEAIDVEEEENRIASPSLVFANSMFLMAALWVLPLHSLFNSLKKGVPFYNRSRFTSFYEWIILFQVFRI